MGQVQVLHDRPVWVKFWTTIFYIFQPPKFFLDKGLNLPSISPAKFLLQILPMVDEEKEIAIR